MTITEAPRPPAIETTRRTTHTRGNILFTFAVAVALALAYLLRHVLFLLYVSALFAVVLVPVVNGITHLRIGKWQPGRGIAILLLLVAVFGGATLFFVFALPPVLRDLQEFIKELPWRGPQLLGRLHRFPLMSHMNFSNLNARIQSVTSSAAEYIFLSLKNWASKLADVIMAIVLTVYFLLEGESAYHWSLSFFPRELRLRLDRTLQSAEVRMGKWLLGQGLLMLILGVSSTIVFVLLKIRYAYALGVLMGALNLIPIAGAMMSMSLVLLAASMDSWGKVLGALIFYLIYAQVETSYLTPRIMQRSVDLAGLAVIIALLVGSELAGIVGAMVSVPTAVLVAVLVKEYLVRDDAPNEAAEIGV